MEISFGDILGGLTFLVVIAYVIYDVRIRGKSSGATGGAVSGTTAKKQK